jgi:hypothetical protein
MIRRRSLNVRLWIELDAFRSGGANVPRPTQAIARH